MNFQYTVKPSLTAYFRFALSYLLSALWGKDYKSNVRDNNARTLLTCFWNIYSLNKCSMFSICECCTVLCFLFVNVALFYVFYLWMLHCSMFSIIMLNTTQCWIPFNRYWSVCRYVLCATFTMLSSIFTTLYKCSSNRCTLKW